MNKFTEIVRELADRQMEEFLDPERIAADKKAAEEFDYSSGEWEVHTKNGPDSPHFEICVIKSWNTHGKKSYGWFDQWKRLVSENVTWSVDQFTWDELIKVAEKLRDRLNAEARTQIH